MTQDSATLSPRQGLAYGLLGLPLAFVALPLYVLLPHHYAQEYGLPLSRLGGLLLAARLADALVDPWLGRFCDQLYAQSLQVVLGMSAIAACVLALSLVLLFYPRVQGPDALLAWAGGFLLSSYAAFSLLTIAHQSWGARLGGHELQRGRIVAWREGAGLVGVLLASVLPGLAGLPAMLTVFVLSLALACWAWSLGPRPVLGESPTRRQGVLWAPWRDADFRRLLAVFMLNGTASAVPATLVLFFVQDRLQAPAAEQPLFLALYFACAAASIPLWLRCVARLGLARTWLAGMLLAVLVFGWAGALGAGDGHSFLLICALSGIALGTDLAVPGALLAGLLNEPERGRAQAPHGAYFGWWNFATKLNLALAAGLALPLLGSLGYQPGSRDDHALLALSLTYALLPCGLKLLAAGALHTLIRRQAQTALRSSP